VGMQMWECWNVKQMSSLWWLFNYSPVAVRTAFHGTGLRLNWAFFSFSYSRFILIVIFWSLTCGRSVGSRELFVACKIIVSYSIQNKDHPVSRTFCVNPLTSTVAISVQL